MCSVCGVFVVVWCVCVWKCVVCVCVVYVCAYKCAHACEYFIVPVGCVVTGNHGYY